MALDVTIGGEFTESYPSVAEADDYFASHWSLTKQEAWAALSVAQRERLLKSSTSMVDALRYLDDAYGYSQDPDGRIIKRYYETQRLSFPRNLDIDSTGDVFVPQEVKDAVCEQAVYAITFDETVMAAAIQGLQEESLAAGPVRMYAHYREGGSMLAPMAVELLRPFFRTGVKVRRA